jgi:hypothetical protein
MHAEGRTAALCHKLPSGREKGQSQSLEGSPTINGYFAASSAFRSAGRSLLRAIQPHGSILHARSSVRVGVEYVVWAPSMEGTMPKWLITTTSWVGAVLAALCAAALALVKFEITTSAGLYFFYGLLVGLVATGIGFLLGWRTDWRVLIIGVVVVLAIVAAVLAYDLDLFQIRLKHINPHLSGGNLAIAVCRFR